MEISLNDPRHHIGTVCDGSLFFFFLLTWKASSRREHYVNSGGKLNSKRILLLCKIEVAELPIIIMMMMMLRQSFYFSFGNVSYIRFRFNYLAYILLYRNGHNDARPLWTCVCHHLVWELLNRHTGDTHELLRRPTLICAKRPICG